MEGQERWLFENAYSLPSPANIVEIGSFKGRSTCFLMSGCRGTEKRVFAIDTFNGNNDDFGYRDYFAEFSQNVKRCGLSEYVQPVVGLSSKVAESWNKPIHLLFIDGSHVYEDVLSDFEAFFPHVVPGGIVAFHDVIEAWPGPLRVWHDIVKHRLVDVGYRLSLAYGRKPRRNRIS
jgi:predicted O-methyltransferase YrrM